MSAYDEGELWDQMLAALLAEHALLDSDELERAEALKRARGESLRTTVVKEGLVHADALEALYQSSADDEPLLPVPRGRRADLLPSDYDSDAPTSHDEAHDSPSALDSDAAGPTDAPASGAPASDAPDSAAAVPPATPGAPPGRRLGAYVVLGELGRGGCGVVHRAYDLRGEREVALKQLLRASETALHRFEREREAAARLRHENVVPVLDAGEAGGLPYLVMELVDGPSLAVLCRDEQGGPQPPPVDTAARWLRDAARGVAAAHAAGVLHRDLKPHNVLVGSDDRARVVDFGLAQMVERGATFTRTGATIGTLAFMPPEQIASGGKALGESCDVYGLGATLYFALSGQPPFDAKRYGELLEQVKHAAPRPLSELNPEVPPPLDALVQRCLAKDPRGRPPSAAALAEALDQHLAGTLRLPSDPPPLLPLAALALLASGLLVSLLVLGAAWRGPAPASPTPQSTPFLSAPPPAQWTRPALRSALAEWATLPALYRRIALTDEVSRLSARFEQRWRDALGQDADALGRLLADQAEPGDEADLAALASASLTSEEGASLAGLAAAAPRARVQLSQQERQELIRCAAFALHESGLGDEATLAFTLEGENPAEIPPQEQILTSHLGFAFARLAAQLTHPRDAALALVPLSRADMGKHLGRLAAPRDQRLRQALRPWVASGVAYVDSSAPWGARLLGWIGEHQAALSCAAAAEPALRGELLAAAGRWGEAEALLARAVDASSGPAAWLARARTRRHRGLLAGASADLVQARARAPSSAAVAREEANVALLAKQPARALIRRALALDPFAAEAWWLVQREAKQRDDRATQALALERVLDLDPHDAEACYLRGRLLLARGRLAELRRVVELMGRALASEPARPLRYLLLRGTAHERLDELDAARRDFDRAVVAAPESALAWANRAHVNTRRGDPARALDDCAEALRHAPRLPVAWLNQGEALLKLERWSEAARSFERASELGREGQALFGLASVARGRGDPRGELANLRALLRRQPWRRLAWDRLAELHLERGDLQAAYDALSQVLARGPSAERYARRAGVARAGGAEELAEVDLRYAEWLGPE